MSPFKYILPLFAWKVYVPWSNELVSNWAEVEITFVVPVTIRDAPFVAVTKNSELVMRGWIEAVMLSKVALPDSNVYSLISESGLGSSSSLCQRPGPFQSLGSAGGVKTSA